MKKIMLFGALLGAVVYCMELTFVLVGHFRYRMTIEEPEFKGSRAGERCEIDLPGGVKMAFVWCPPGSFHMGSSGGSRQNPRMDKPLSREFGNSETELTMGFWLAECEVTKAQWNAVMEDDSSRHDGCSVFDNWPQTSISWVDCLRFMEKVRELNPKCCLRFPTEAEWEYACRTGRDGDIQEDLYGKVSVHEKTGMGLTLGVSKELLPNEWGLYGMIGNVREWCYDGAPPLPFSWFLLYEKRHQPIYHAWEYWAKRRVRGMSAYEQILGQYRDKHGIVRLGGKGYAVPSQEWDDEKCSLGQNDSSALVGFRPCCVRGMRMVGRD